MNVHFIIHEAFEAPGAYELWAKSRQHTIGYSRVYLGDKLPNSAQDIDLLIVMGGPQDPNVTIAQCPYFDSMAEQRIICSAIEQQKSVIGICLGAQLVGEALGASFSASPHPEIGKFPISLTTAGKNHAFFSHFGDSLEVGHWHNDMPGLTPDSEVIAVSEGCPRQIVAYSDLVYGFQCHMEFTPEVIELLIGDAGADLHATQDRASIDSIITLRAHNCQEMNETLFIYLDKLADHYQLTRSR
ncbi:glutamine amidotransferase-related protein [Rosenbergiella epipactidis]|uniref:glutamine amidotransferase-related protein n=1 Tax=Rosenbergiella epipactidis TaxID=1544694 RepID=UPI001F4F853C|nr:glutamine amidotransferase [Rosenbergiella epipactidis]